MFLVFFGFFNISPLARALKIGISIGFQSIPFSFYLCSYIERDRDLIGLDVSEVCSVWMYSD